jgi:hypothetical protein
VEGDGLHSSAAGTAIDAPASGNAAMGDAIFWGKAECGKCHMIRGKGGIVGPGAHEHRRHPEDRVDCRRAHQSGYRVQGDGGAIPRKLEVSQQLSGRARDAARWQGDSRSAEKRRQRVVAGARRRRQPLHLLDRARLKDVVYEKTSLMPRDYKSRLTAQEFQDLVAFLTRQSRREARAAEK